MKVNINHPSFLSYLDNITNQILSIVDVKKYFSLCNDKKIKIQCMVMKFLKNSTKVRAKLTDSEMISFINVLCKKNEDSENYEFAAVLKDMLANFETINEVVKPKINKKSSKIIKTNEEQ
jgi:hypothetical protein